MKILILISFISCFGIVNAWAQRTSNDNAFSKSDSTAYFYFYRPFKLMGAAIRYHIYINDTKVGRLGVRDAFKVPIIQSGKTELWAKTEITKGLVIDVQPHQSYYIKCGISWGLLVGHPKLKRMSPGIGEWEYKIMKGQISPKQLRKLKRQQNDSSKP